MLRRAALGFGSLALTDLLARSSLGKTIPSSAFPNRKSKIGNRTSCNPLAPKLPPLPARAKRVIFLFMNGGPSQVDTFDYKPELNRRHGQTAEFKNTRTRVVEARTLMGSPFDFSQHGQSGAWVSELFPHVARHADDLCFIKSVQTDAVAHGPATLFFHTGATTLVRPSMGAWITYGLGSENENLPGFVSICPSALIGGVRNYGSAFLPGVYAGTALGKAERPATEAKFRNLPSGGIPDAQRAQFDLLRRLNRTQAHREAEPEVLESAINSFEMAFGMQQHAPDIADLSREPEGTRAMYGIGKKATDDFGRQCLLARRLSESGVRFVQVNFTDNTTTPKWDQHRDLEKDHRAHARAVDRPIAALLADLKQRGLLDETLVLWAGEFGRTPYSENNNGRDHNPHTATLWMAGGGVKRGFSYGASDALGFKAVENKVHVHDLHATLLHLLGFDHEELTYKYSGRPFRLTDVYGSVIHDIVA